MFIRIPNGMKAIAGLTVNIKQGEFVYVVGPSGAGKSTFIKMMYREEKPSTGSINVNGLTIETLAERDVPYFRRQLGVIFQDFKLLPKLTVYENVSFALEVIEEEPDAIRERERVTEVLGLAKAFRWPTGNLDIETALDIMNIFTRINERGTTIVMATHNADIVNTIRHRVIAIEGGKIVRDEIEGGYGYEG